MKGVDYRKQFKVDQLKHIDMRKYMYKKFTRDEELAIIKSVQDALDKNMSFDAAVKAAANDRDVSTTEAKIVYLHLSESDNTSTQTRSFREYLNESFPSVEDLASGPKKNGKYTIYLREIQKELDKIKDLGKYKVIPAGKDKTIYSIPLDVFTKFTKLSEDDVNEIAGRLVNGEITCDGKTVTMAIA